jgi:hypothetical protein
MEKIHLSIETWEIPIQIEILVTTEASSKEEAIEMIESLDDAELLEIMYNNKEVVGNLGMDSKVIH